MRAVRLVGPAACLLAIAGASPSLAQVSSAGPAVAPAPSPAAEPDPRNLALATEIIDISYPPERRNALLLRRMDNLLERLQAATGATRNEEPEEGLQQIRDRYRARMRNEMRVFAEHMPALYGAYARAYARAFTHDELVQIRAFVGTPAGTRFVQRTGDLLIDPDIARTSTASMTAAMVALQPLEDQFSAEVQAYVERRNRQAPH